jgi:imidazole glycerol phosphate synthase glutamine amidotransferase subunit
VAALSRKNIKLGIIDYAASNLRSVEKAFTHLGADVIVSSKSEELDKVDALIFPGQGSNDSAMQALDKASLVQPIVDFVKNDRPFLGICMGLQLLMQSSEEGIEPCFGLFDGSVKKFSGKMKVPHMGWNQVLPTRKHQVFNNLPIEPYFYFVHSYYADPLDKNLVLATTDYGNKFASAISYGNLVAVQFHPEKSGSIGLEFYRNFLQFVKVNV